MAIKENNIKTKLEGNIVFTGEVEKDLLEVGLSHPTWAFFEITNPYHDWEFDEETTRSTCLDLGREDVEKLVEVLSKWLENPSQ